MIEARHLTKRYGHTVAVDEASFVVRPGRVTGFLGPIGALLEAKAIVGGRTAAHHLLWLAASNGITRRRVSEILDIALLRIRNLMKSLAAQGRTVFLSSHLMSEMAQTADYLLVIGRGRFIADASTDEFINRNSIPTVQVRAVQQDLLADVLNSRGALLDSGPACALVVSGLDAAVISQTAATYAITQLELATHSATLEEAFFDLTRDETDYHADQLADSSKGI